MATRVVTILICDECQDETGVAPVTLCLNGDLREIDLCPRCRKVFDKVVGEWLAIGRAPRVKPRLKCKVPGCKDTFPTEAGRKIHAGRKHKAAA